MNLNFQPPEYDDPRDEEDRLNDGIGAMLADKLGFSVEERAGCPVINEDGDMREADLCHRVLWDEMVSLIAERDRLSAINAELLEALGRSAEVLDRLTDKIQATEFSCSKEFYSALDEIDLGRAAIAKAQGEQQ